ncbi:MAG: hypothetical protein R2883_03280 [Caldisericia bacterium]
MKKAIILSVSILLVLGFGFLFAYNFVSYGGDEKLAEGSYRTKNFFLFDVKNDTLPKKNTNSKQTLIIQEIQFTNQLMILS